MTKPLKQNETGSTSVLVPDFIQHFIQMQLESNQVATQEVPIHLHVDETGEDFYLYVDWTLGYVVQMYNYNELEGKAQLQFYTFNGEVYVQDEQSPLPLPITIEAILNFFPLLYKKDPITYDKEMDLYQIKVERDSLGRHILIKLNESKTGLVVEYSALSDSAVGVLGRDNLPEAKNIDNHGSWVVYKAEYELEKEQIDKLLKSKDAKD